MLSHRSLVCCVLVGLVALGFGVVASQTLPPGDPAPEIAGERWINGGPLTMQELWGRVVLVEFWTFG